MVVGVLTGNFNSQPHKEADTGTSTTATVFTDFNSQPHKEADGPTGPQGPKGDISTHSLTRRLTRGPRGKRAIPEHFNSQPHKEADFRLFSVPVSAVSFQLTASQGG